MRVVVNVGDVLKHRQSNDGTATVMDIVNKECMRVLFESTRGKYKGTINPKHLLAVYEPRTKKSE